MRLTPELLAATYDLLRLMEPWNKLSLPDSEDIKFKVLKTTRYYGDCIVEGGKFTIRVSEGKHSRVTRLLETVGHEMFHVHLDDVGHGKDSMRHGPNFRALAIQACSQHPEFDIVTF